MNLYIIIPTFNRGYCIKNGLNSLISQENFSFCQIIVVDDGSTDNTKKIMEKYKKKYKNITYIYQKNQGVCGASQRGIEYCLKKFDVEKGYILRMGSDDELLSGAIKTIYEHINNQKYTFLSFGIVNEQNKKITQIKCNNKHLSFQEYITEKYISGNDSANVMKLAIFKDKKYVFKKELISGDEITVSSIIKDFGTFVINKYIYIAPQNSEGLTRRKLSIKHIKNLFNIENRFLDLFSEDYKKGNKKKLGSHMLIMAKYCFFLGKIKKGFSNLIQGIYYSPLDIVRIGMAIIAILPFGLGIQLSNFTTHLVIYSKFKKSK